VDGCHFAIYVQGIRMFILRTTAIMNKLTGTFRTIRLRQRGSVQDRFRSTVLTCGNSYSWNGWVHQ